MIRRGILTYFARINFGAFLQSYALSRFVGDRFRDAV